MALAARITDLLGPRLVNHSGAAVETASALAGLDYVALYFSAHWCPPCKMTTPVLSTWCSKHHAAKKMTFVFVSSDRDEKTFRDYFGEMSWGLALPFEERDKKNSISRTFGVQGIPTVAILDAHTGETITTDAAGLMRSDGSGAAFPYRPKSVFDILESTPVLDKEGLVVPMDRIRSADMLGLYFSASWCPPCVKFTPALSSWYSKMTAPGGKGTLDGQKLEVVFVSADRSEADALKYYEKMSFKRLAFDATAKADLNALFKVEGIPTLVFVGKDGKVVTDSGTSKVGGSGDEYPWPAKAVNTLEGCVDSINDTPTLVLFTDFCTDDAAIVAAAEAFTAVAEEHFAAGDVAAGRIKFAIAAEGDGAIEPVRDFLGPAHQRDKNGPTAIRVTLVDVSGQKKYLYNAGAPGVPDQPSLSAFVKAFLAGVGPGVSIKA